VKLGEATRRTLEDIRRNGDPWARCFSRSQHGGMWKVMRFIEHTHKLAKYDKRKDKWKLTPAGVEALDGIPQKEFDKLISETTKRIVKYSFVDGYFPTLRKRAKRR
jgi:hypothetical protein